MDWLSIREFLLDTVKYVIVIFAILFVITFVFSATQVVGSSMVPTLRDGDILLVKYEDTKYLIKRVIGMPGDSVMIVDSKLYINGVEYKEDYLAKGLVYDDFKLSDLGYSKIPEGMYLVLGDNRPKSKDSREIGLIKKEDIIGKISFRFWPFNRWKFL